MTTKIPMQTKYRLAGLVLFGLLTVSVWLLWPGRYPKAPDVTFKTITGKAINLKTHLGKPVIITFWATSCPGCIAEMPHLIELYQDYHPRGLEIIAVAMFYDPPNRVVAMTRARKLPYDIALDLMAENARAFGDVKLTPTTFLIAPDGSIVLSKIGTLDIHRLKNRIENLLKG
jgi:thiol-disulfide isomerase/thioredoxin